MLMQLLQRCSRVASALGVLDGLCLTQQLLVVSSSVTIAAQAEVMQLAMSLADRTAGDKGGSGGGGNSRGGSSGKHNRHN